MPSLDLTYYLHCPSNSSLRLLLYTSLGITSLLILRFQRNARHQEKLTAILPSPLTTLIPRLSEDDVANLPYPPDVLPGARDVETPYGSVRVYEWGPEDGRKVLLIHGISTPCISLAGIASKLVERGCRVMLFGKWEFP
jgi:hypothetical protein